MIGFILILVFLIGLFWLLSIQRAVPPLKKETKVKKPYRNPRTMPRTFVPIEDVIVPTSASHTNKMKNKLGNVNSSQGYGPGILEVVIPSDFYQFSSRPGEYYWPSGSILPDYIFNGDGVHKRIVV
jgi:hypothetical protein